MQKRINKHQKIAKGLIVLILLCGFLPANNANAERETAPVLAAVQEQNTPTVPPPAETPTDNPAISPTEIPTETPVETAIASETPSAPASVSATETPLPTHK